MIKMKFGSEGGVQLQFPKPKNAAQQRCFDRIEEIMEVARDPSPALPVLLGIAAMNGPKTFDRAVSYFGAS
ncbi:hypothetical protein [Actibacterium sp. MT2.3-13A]|uniref:hypothetical protein n=1 Tax=Actibacterium sp. MT2.3-13A TaxID=2828332 RepID=UPI001BA9BCBC|nr:hypothetical protein [Actibacterium sp. MT2.3-13A]